MARHGSPSRREIQRCASAQFLGYGNPAASIWFVGQEEGGAEVTRGSKIPLKQSLCARARFKRAMPFHRVWVDEFKADWEGRKWGTWNWAARFMLNLRGNPDPNGAQVQTYRQHDLGRVGGDAFCPEMYPLPMPGDRAFSKRSWYEGGPWTSCAEYRGEVGPRRARTLVRLLLRHREVRWVIVYARAAVPLLLAAWPGEWVRATARLPDRVRCYSLRRGRSKRVVRLISTPFWGNGQFCGDALRAVARFVAKDGFVA